MPARPCPNRRNSKYSPNVAQWRVASHSAGCVRRNQAKRAGLYKEAQKILVDDAPWVFVDHEVQIAAISKRVQGFRLHPSFDLRVETVSLK